MFLAEKSPLLSSEVGRRLALYYYKNAAIARIFASSEHHAERE